MKQFIRGGEKNQDLDLENKFVISLGSTIPIKRDGNKSKLPKNLRLLYGGRMDRHTWCLRHCSFPRSCIEFCEVSRNEDIFRIVAKTDEFLMNMLDQGSILRAGVGMTFGLTNVAASTFES